MTRHPPCGTSAFSSHRFPGMRLWALLILTTGTVLGRETLTVLSPNDDPPGDTSAWPVVGRRMSRIDIGPANDRIVFEAYGDEAVVIGGVNVRDWAAAGNPDAFPNTENMRTTVWPQPVGITLGSSRP